MINFNEDIVIRLQEYLTKVSNRAISSFRNSSMTPDDKKKELEGLTAKVEFISSTHDEGDPQDFVSNEDTCWHHTIYKLVLTKNEKEVASYTSKLDIPYMMEGGMFIVDGKIRISTNVLSTDYDCSYNPKEKRFQLNGVTYHIFKNSLKVSYYKDGNKYTEYVLNQSELEQLGVDLSLSVEQVEKIQYLIDIPFDEKLSIPPVLDFDFILSLPTYPVVETRRDSVATLKIQSVNESLMSYLNTKEVLKSTISAIKGDLFPQSKAPGFACSTLMKPIMRFLRRSADAGIDIATVVNPLVFDQLHNKLKMPEYMPYTFQLRDILDAPNTPENNNVNIINELNVCIFHNDEVGIGIHCYSYPSGEKVDVRYNTYINEYSLHYSEWDYDNNVLKDPTKREYLVNYHTNTMTIKVEDLSKVKYVEPKLDDKFSLSSRNIPFLNCSDHVRIAMANGMIKQSVELENPEEPLISSGNANIDSTKSTLNTYASEDGVVVTKDGVDGIQYDSGAFQPFPKAISGINHVTISHDNLVNVGDRVKKGQKLTSAYSATDGYSLGSNALVFYINYLGKTFEDGQVISESFAEKLAHWTIHDVTVDILLGDKVNHLAELGSKVKSGDKLVELMSNPTSLEGKQSGTGINYLTNVSKVPNNISDGTIIDAVFYTNPNSNSQVNKSEVVTGFLSSKSNLSDEAKSNIDSVPARYRSQRFSERVSWTRSTNKKGQSIVAKVRYKIAVRRPVVIGDKLCNRFGSKGMVSLILPDNCMPYYIDAEGNKVIADIVANPASIVSRKNVSQLHEALLSRCIRKMYELAKNAKSDEELESVLSIIKDNYGAQHAGLELEGLKAMINDGIKAFTMYVGTFVENAYDKVMKIADNLGVSDKEEIYAPSISIRENLDFSEEAKNLGTEVVLIEDEDGNIDQSKEFKDGTSYYLGWIDEPVVVGVNYYMKLFHSAVWSGSTTGALQDRAKSPLLGKGKSRATGQVIGEMEGWALKSTGATGLIQDKNYSPTFEQSQWELLASYMRSGIELTK